NGLAPHARAIVHSSRTGRALAWVGLPKDTELATVAAAPSDREFFLAIVEPGPKNPNTYLYRLLKLAPGRWRLLPRTLLVSSGKDIVGVTGLAVSPDSTKLAAMIADFRGTSAVPVGEIRVFSLRGGKAHTWTALRDPADASHPVWVSNTSLAF